MVLATVPDEEPAGDFLSGADFREGTEGGEIEINGERFVVRVEFFSGRHGQAPGSGSRVPRFAGWSRRFAAVRRTILPEIFLFDLENGEERDKSGVSRVVRT